MSKKERKHEDQEEQEGNKEKEEQLKQEVQNKKGEQEEKWGVGDTALLCMVTYRATCQAVLVKFEDMLLLDIFVLYFK